MNPVCSAPALVILLAIVASLSGTSGGLPLPASIFVGTVTAAGTLCLIDEVHRRDYRRPVLFLLVLAAGLSCLSVYRVHQEPLLLPRVDGTFQVIQERSWGSRRLMVLSGSQGRYIARVRPSPTFTEGTMVRVKGSVMPLERAEGARDFDEYDYWRARGVSGAVKVEQIRTARGEGSLLHRWRQGLRERILLDLPPRVRGYLLACWLGDRDPDLKQKHQSWGTSHLLAVSGFHVGLVCALGYWLFRRRTGREIAISVLLWGYVLMAGGSASALRAGLMIQIMLIGSILGRGANPLNSVAAAACLLLLWRPWWFWDVGWRLSVLAALSLAALSRFKGRWRIVAASPLVWTVTAGQATWTFGAVPLAGLIINFVAMPVFGILLPLAAILSLPVVIGLPGGMAFPAEGLFLLWERVAGPIVHLLPFSVGWSGALGILSGGLFLSVISRSLGFSPVRTTIITTFLLIMGTWLST